MGRLLLVSRALIGVFIVCTSLDLLFILKAWFIIGDICPHNKPKVNINSISHHIKPKIYYTKYHYNSLFYRSTPVGFATCNSKIQLQAKIFFVATADCVYRLLVDFVCKRICDLDANTVAGG